MRELLIMDDTLSNLTVDSKLLQESATSKKIEEYPLISMCAESSFLEKECLDQKDESNCDACDVQRELQKSSVLVPLDTTQHENIKKSLVTCDTKELRHCTIQSPETIHREVKLLPTVEMQCSEEEREVKCKDKFHEGIECPPKCSEGKDHSSGYVSQCVINSSSKEVVEEQVNSSESSSESSSGQETSHCRTVLKDINPFKLLEEEKNQNHMRYLLQNLPDLAKYFNLHKKIGVGTFSSVFLGSLKDSVIQRFPELKDRKFAIKHLVPVLHPRRIARELKYLHQIGGKDNVIGVDLSLRNGDCVVFIMPYLCHKRFSDYVLDMDASETRDYMRNLMIALKRVHSFNVIHRDVKPSNFLYNRELKRYLLVDFGLSQNVHPQAKLTTEDRERKRKRQEENSNENVRKLDSSTTISNSRTKKIALQPRAKEENMVRGSNGTSQPIKRIKLYEQSSRGQKMIEHLFQQQQNTIENKRIPLSSKVVNQRNTLSENFRLPYSSPKANSKNVNVKKKLFSPNSENNSPKEMKPSIKGVSPIPPNAPGVLTPSRSAQINMEPLKSSSLKSLTNMENHNSSLGTSLQNELSRQKFQTLEPRPCKNGNQTGSTVLRVQNSQVKSQTMKPLSPLESERQRKMLFTSQKNRKLSQLLEEPKCFCKGKPHVCSVCLKHKTIPAPRAGTPGFRPPEVLLKYPMQTTAVDMWAAGVIMLCILSGCCPFFRSPDDITGLAEIMTIFGTERIQEVAKRLGRIVHCSNNKPPLNLRKLCERLRRRRKDRANGIIDVINSLPICPKCENTIESELEGCLCLKPDSGTCSGEFPSSAYDLLHRLLDPNPVTRITAEEALQHSFLKEY